MTMPLIRRIAGIQLTLAVAALVVMGATTAADVALKYLFARPIVGAYDVVESLLPVVIFHGLPATILRRQNIAIDLVDQFVSRGGKRVLLLCGDIVMLALLCLVTWAMTTPALQAYGYGDRKLELGLPLAVVWFAAVVGMVGSCLAAAAVAERSARGEAA